MADGTTRDPASGQAPSPRERILSRASELFHQFGFKRVTMDDISHQLGMSKKTLYQHIPGKDALVEAFVENLLNRTISTAREMFDETQDIVSVTRKLIPMIHRRLSVVSPVMMADLQRHWPHLWDRINHRRMAVLDLYLGQLEDAKAKGMLRDEVNPKVMVRIVQTVVQEVANPKTIMELEVPAAELLQTFMTIMLRGALSDEAQRRFEEGS